MLFQALKDSLSQIAEYNKRRMFLDLGFVTIAQESGRMTIRHSIWQKIFICTLTFLFGPVLATALATGLLDMSDAPILAWIVAILVPVAMTIALLSTARRMLFAPTSIVLDGVSRRIRLINPPCREYYPGKRWPQSIAADAIHSVEIRTQANSDGADCLIMDLYLNADDYLILMATQSQDKIDRISNFLYDRLGVRPAE